MTESEPERLSALARHTGWNGLGQLAPQVTQIALTPYIIHRVGIDRYGVWALTGVIVAVVATFDGGITPSLTYFFARHRGSEDRAAAIRLLATAVVAFAVIGLFATAAFAAVMPTIVNLAHISTKVAPDALGVRWFIGPSLGVSLLGGVFDSFLQGNDRFRDDAIVSVARIGLTAAFTIWFLESGHGLRALFEATILAGALSAAAAALVGVRFADLGKVGWIRSNERRELWAVAWRMQGSGLTRLLNVEVDALVIGALLPVRDVGFYTVGANVANAVRSIPVNALPPIFTRLTRAFVRGGMGSVEAEYLRVNGPWLVAIVGYGAVALAATGFGVSAWLGPHFNRAGVVAVILLVGYSVNLFTGVASMFVRAVGRPGLETRYGWCCTFVNAVLTVPLGVLFGLYGVVGATAVGSVVGSLYFVRILRREVPAASKWGWPAVRIAPVGATVVIATGLELLVRRVGVSGVPGLALAGVPALGALALYAGLTRDVFARARHAHVGGHDRAAPAGTADDEFA